jgi:hypothetical protein
MTAEGLGFVVDGSGFAREREHTERHALIFLVCRLDQANKRKLAAAAAAAAPASSSMSKKSAASAQTFAAVRGKDWQVLFNLFIFYLRRLVAWSTTNATK